MGHRPRGEPRRGSCPCAPSRRPGSVAPRGQDGPARAHRCGPRGPASSDGADGMSAAFELPVSQNAPPPARTAPGADTVERLARRARWLSWLSLAWMTVEGAVALAAGVAAGSIALVGFGLDSAVEGFASVIIIWRFTGNRIHSAAAEDR